VLGGCTLCNAGTLAFWHERALSGTGARGVATIVFVRFFFFFFLKKNVWPHMCVPASRVL
jgi:hypothetical protein